MQYEFYKENKNNIIWDVEEPGQIGKMLFSFDKRKIYNFWADYPQNLTPEEKKIFDKEKPYWANFHNRKGIMF